jgi:hypothetical protein
MSGVVHGHEGELPQAWPKQKPRVTANSSAKAVFDATIEDDICADLLNKFRALDELGLTLSMSLWRQGKFSRYPARKDGPSHEASQTDGVTQPTADMGTLCLEDS